MFKNIFKKADVSHAENPSFMGKFRIEVFNPDGSLKQDTGWLHNLLTDAGMAALASRVNGDGAEAVFTTLAVGVGTTGAAQGNTTLETEITDSGLGRSAATASRTTTTETNDTARLVKQWSVSGTKSITEVGILNNATSGGTLLCRQTFTAVPVQSGDTFQITYDIVCARAA